MWIIALAVAVVSIALLVLFGSREEILGLDPNVFGGVAFFSALLLAWSGWFARQLRHDFRNTLQSIAAWIGILIVLVGFYAYRFTFQDVANRILAEISPGLAISAREGEVEVVRDDTGSFVLAGKINGVSTRLIFDTGASSIVLTARTAEGLGLKVGEDAYTVRVSTANGRTEAAPVKLDSVSIGDITERNIEALVARPGALRENLLGMNFLERLTSYEVRENMLVLRQ